MNRKTDILQQFNVTLLGSTTYLIDTENNILVDSMNKQNKNQAISLQSLTVKCLYYLFRLCFSLARLIRSSDLGIHWHLLVIYSVVLKKLLNMRGVWSKEGRNWPTADIFLTPTESQVWEEQISSAFLKYKGFRFVSS